MDSLFASSPVGKGCTEPTVLSLHHSHQHYENAPIISVVGHSQSPLRPRHGTLPTVMRTAALSRTLFTVFLLVCGISCSYAHESAALVLQRYKNAHVALLRGNNNRVHRIPDIQQQSEKEVDKVNTDNIDDRRILSFGRRSDPDENKDRQQEQQEGQQGNNDGIAPPPNTAEAGGGNTYGTYGTYMNNSGGAESGQQQQQSGGNTNEGSSSYGTGGESSYSTTGTAAGGGESSYSTPGTYGTAGGYGSSSNSYSGDSSYGAGTSSSYGGSSTYGSGSTYGTSSYGSGSSYGSSTYDSGGGYSSTWGAADSWGTTPESKKSKFLGPFHGALDVKISLLSSILLLVFISLMGMVLTAHKMEHDPEGNYANCCRVLLNAVNCIYKVIYSLYHCRLGDIPQVVFASELEEDEYTDEELEHMRLRPGIERALDVEHRKALRKVGIEMNKIKVTTATKNGAKNGGGGVQR